MNERTTQSDIWETVVGLEIHAQLATHGKLFARARAGFAPDEPNTHVTPYCLGLPGTLPRIDAEAVRLAVRAALALGCTVHETSRFDRKHYFYPDLPKGYQITQAHAPLATAGRIALPGSDRGAVRIERLHLEEDAGKLVAIALGRVGVDYNRAGVPLIEIVTAPDLRSGEEAASALREVRAVLTTLGVNDGNLEHGSLRCDANVSVRPRGASELGTRSEVKNVNGFRFVARAVEAEAARQIAILEAGGTVTPQTRGYDASQRTTHVLRAKVDEADYRYFPDPDLPALVLSAEDLRSEATSLPELPAARRTRWMAAGLPEEHAVTFAADVEVGDFFDRAISGAPELTVPIGHLVKTSILRRIAEDRAAFRRLQPDRLAEVARAKADGRISSSQQRAMLDALFAGAPSFEAALEAAGGNQVQDEAELRAWVTATLDACPDEVEAYRRGKTKVLGFFIGQVMKRSGGRADPRRARTIIEEDLASR